MKFLAITRRRIEQFTEAEFEGALGPEAEAVRAAYARGEVREVYSRGDVPGAVLVLEAADNEAAWAIVEAFPFARAGMMDVDVVPLKPYRAFV